MGADWEQQFEECVARERSLMIALIDASRAMPGGMGPAGKDPAEAGRAFAERYAEWREAANAVDELARQRLERR